MKLRTVLASLVCGGLLALGVGLTSAQTGTDGPDAAKVREQLKQQEQRLLRQFKDFETSLHKLKRRLSASKDPDDRAKADLLDRVLEKVREESIIIQFEQINAALKEGNFKDIVEIRDVLNKTKELSLDLQDILALMREDPRYNRVREEKLQLEKAIALLKEALEKARDIEARIDTGKADPKELEPAQAQVTKATEAAGKIVDKLGKGGDKGGEGGEAKPAKGEAKPGEGKGGEKSGEAKEGGKSPEGAAGEAKENKGGEKGAEGGAKGAEGSKAGEGDPKGGSKAGEGGDPKGGAKGSKGGEGASGSKGAGGDKGKEGDKGGAKGDGTDKNPVKDKTDPGSAKGGEKGDGSKGKDGEKPGESKSGAGAESKGGDSKGSKGGEAKSGSKSGSPSESKGGAKGGESSSGQGSPKDGGGEGSPSKGSKGGGDEGGKKDQPLGKKQIEDAEGYSKSAEKKIKKPDLPGAGEDETEVIKNLEKAKKQLEDLLRQIREEELERLLAQLQARCEKMLAMQIRVYNETIDNFKKVETHADKQPDRDDKLHSLKLSKDESDIVVEATKAIQMLEAEGTAVAFPVVFEQVREDMKIVQRRLEIADTGKVTQAIEQDIIDTLKEMVEALKKAREENKDSKSGKSGKPGEKGPPQDQKLLDQIAELKMIKSMQERVNARTKTYARLYDGEQARDPNIVRELRGIADRQQRITEVTGRIAKGDNK